MITQSHPVVWNRDFETQATKGPLSTHELKHFDERGFLILRQVFTPAEIDALRDEVFDVKARIESEGAADKVTEDMNVVTEPNSKKLRSIFEVHKNLKLAKRLTQDSRLLDRAQQILADDQGLYVHQSRVNFQQGFEGTGFSWHSDFETWHAEDGMPEPRCLSCVVLLTPNYAQNGSLMVVPGSHKTYMRCAGETPERFWETSLKDKLTIGTPAHELLTEVINDSGEMAYCEGEPGDVVMFDCNLMHASHNNVSPWPRTNMFFVYNSVSNKVQDPPYAKTPRPEHIATRDSEFTKGLERKEGAILE